jgi:hypothetical protein
MMFESMVESVLMYGAEIWMKETGGGGGRECKRNI